MSRKWSIVIVLSVVVALLPATFAGAATVFSENFDDPVLPELHQLSWAPTSWSLYNDEVDMRIASGLHDGWVGKAIDMSDSIYFGGRQYKNLPQTMTNNQEWVLSYDAWVSRVDTFNCSFGFGGTDLLIAPDQPIVAMGYSGSFEGNAPRWWFDARYITGPAGDWINLPDDGTFSGNTVRVEIHINGATNKVWGVVTDGTNTLTTPVLDTYQDRELEIGSLRAHVEIYRVPDGIDIDNINVEADYLGTLAGYITLGDYGTDVSLAPVGIQIRYKNGSLYREENVTLSENGGYYEITSIAAGTYDVAYRGNQWLQKIVQDVVIPADGTEYQNVTLANGDVDGDNEVTSTDLSVVLWNMDMLGDW